MDRVAEVAFREWQHGVEGLAERHVQQITGHRDVDPLFHELSLKLARGPTCQCGCGHLRFKKWDKDAGALCNKHGTTDWELLAIASESPRIDKRRLPYPIISNQ